MKNNSNLEFRKVPSLQFLYEVNENGTIFRNVKSKKQLKIDLDMHHSDKGYYTSFVCIKGKVKRVMMHTIVAECWLGPRPEGLQIDHIDRNTRNNHYSNLRYVDQSAQMKNRILSDRIIEQAKKNCQKWIKSISIKVIATNTKNGDIIEAPSLLETSKLLAKYYGNEKKFEHYRRKLKQRRSHIYDFDITYTKNTFLNAETVHDGSTEQETVH